MEKLPRLYKNDHIQPVDHNRKSYFIKEDDKEDISTVLNEIFNGLGHPYNQKVRIQTEKKSYETYLVSKTKQNLLTLENEIIPISQILSMKKID